MSVKTVVRTSWELIPFLLPNTCRKAPRAVSVGKSAVVGNIPESWSQAGWNSLRLFLLAPKQGDHIQIPCWAPAPGSAAAGLCLEAAWGKCSLEQASFIPQTVPATHWRRHLYHNGWEYYQPRWRLIVELYLWSNQCLSRLLDCGGKQLQRKRIH